MLKKLFWLIVIAVSLFSCLAVLSSIVALVFYQPPSRPTTAPVVLEFDGNGDRVISFDLPQNSATLFTFSHRGESNFIVHLLKADGSILSYLVNDSDNYDGEKVKNLSAGHYMLEITADGRWVITISQ